MISAPPKAGAVLSVEALTRFGADVLRLSGLSAADAAIMAETLVHAQMTGKDSHGLTHLASYVVGIEQGALNPRPVFRISGNMPAAAILDADRAPGALAGTRATDMSIERAARFGVGIVAVRNSSHFGAASAFVSRMASQGFVGLVMSNASPTMAPRGVRVPLLGTNPIAAGFPRSDGPPVILDFASTAGSRGRIRKAAADGAAIPDTWALDANGIPTTDPVAALEGTMQALGGEKGTAIALMVELICVGLSGATAGRLALPPQTHGGTPRGISHVFISISAAAFTETDGIADRVAGVARAIETAPATDPATLPRMPGTRMHAEERKARSTGIEISENLSAILHKAWTTAKALHDKAERDQSP